MRRNFNGSLTAIGLFVAAVLSALFLVAVFALPLKAAGWLR